MEMMPWIVLNVLSNHERTVAQHLESRSFDHYLPLYSEKVRWTDRTVLTERPLFSGYVFVRYSPERRKDAISIPGVIRSLGEESHNTVMGSEIERIRIGLGSGLLLRPYSGYSVGTRVRIRAGAFEGVEGVVTEFRQQSHVIVTLSSARHSFTLEVDAPDIEVLANLNPQRPQGQSYRPTTAQSRDLGICV